MNNKPRKWWLAGLLSFVLPGIGQIYNGQAIKGVAFLFLQIVAIPLQMDAIKNGISSFTLYTILTGTIAFYMNNDLSNCSVCANSNRNGRT
jgi:signal peptidase I